MHFSYSVSLSNVYNYVTRASVIEVCILNGKPVKKKCTLSTQMENVLCTQCIESAHCANEKRYQLMEYFMGHWYW